MNMLTGKADGDPVGSYCLMNYIISFVLHHNARCSDDAIKP